MTPTTTQTRRPGDRHGQHDALTTVMCDDHDRARRDAATVHDGDQRSLAPMRLRRRADERRPAVHADRRTTKSASRRESAAITVSRRRRAAPGRAARRRRAVRLAKPIASSGRPAPPSGQTIGDEEDVAGIERGQHEAGDEGALVHVADRAAELVGHDDQHQRRRDDLRQRAGGRDDAGGEAAVVAVAQHDRQRDQAHRDHRGRDDAGGGGQQRADEDHRIGEAAADAGRRAGRWCRAGPRPCRIVRGSAP